MQKIGSWVLLAALAVGTVYFFWFWPGRAALATFSPIRSGGQTLVLDAGHGGEDGGAVSLSGVPESGINLAIVQKLDQLLGLYGEAPLLLRSEDISLHDDSAQTPGEKSLRPPQPCGPDRGDGACCPAQRTPEYLSGREVPRRSGVLFQRRAQSTSGTTHTGDTAGRTGPGQHP